jgi:NADH:ubiquinone oxidoreductase subunit 5 (subunit L)/multisubunit Na+/H+ antiporter MnhA subunit
LPAAESREAIRFAGLGAAGLGLIGGLALACFSKVSGVLFLGQPRGPSAGAASVREAGPEMAVPALVLAAACIAIGLVPVVVVRPALRVVETIIGPSPDLTAVSSEWTAAAGRVSIVAMVLIAVMLALAWIRRRLDRRREARAVETGACAGPTLTSRMQYTAVSYAAPLLLAVSAPAGFRAGGRHHSVDLVKERAALPAWRRLKELSRRARDWQGARLRWYLLSVIATLVTLLLYHMTWNGEP